MGEDLRWLCAFNPAGREIGSYELDVLAGRNDAIIWIPMATSGTAEEAEGLTTFSAVEADANFPSGRLAAGRGSPTTPLATAWHTPTTRRTGWSPTRTT
jgi:hypothetical protein